MYPLLRLPHPRPKGARWASYHVVTGADKVLRACVNRRRSCSALLFLQLKLRCKQITPTTPFLPHLLYVLSNRPFAFPAFCFFYESWIPLTIWDIVLPPGLLNLTLFALLCRRVPSILCSRISRLRSRTTSRTSLLNFSIGSLAAWYFSLNSNFARRLFASA